MAAISQMCQRHVDSHFYSKIFSETRRSSVKILLSECSLYANYLVQSSLLLGVWTAFPHLFFSTTSLGLRVRIQPFIFYCLCQCRRVNFDSDEILKYFINVKFCQEAKLQAFVITQMISNQPQTFQNRRIFRELNNVMLA